MISKRITLRYVCQSPVKNLKQNNMQFDYKYKGNSTVTSSLTSTGLSFAPDTSRDPTYFSGRVKHPLLFREAISSLHDVVVSDLRFKPRDTSEYKEWEKQQEDQDINGGSPFVQ